MIDIHDLKVIYDKVCLQEPAASWQDIMTVVLKLNGHDTVLPVNDRVTAIITTIYAEIMYKEIAERTASQSRLAIMERQLRGAVAEIGRLQGKSYKVIELSCPS